MAEKLTFVGLEISSFTRTKKATVIKVACELSAPVMRQLDWQEAPECYTGGGLEGDLTATAAEFIPSDGSLSQHAQVIDAVRMNAFKTVRLENKGKRGAGHRTELRFSITSGDLRAAEKLEGYLLVAGKSKLKVAYERVEPKGASGEEDTGCVACNNKIPLQPDNPKKHASGVKCTARPVQEALEVN